MELDFDKEIDALLRQTAKSEPFAMANGSNAPAHIDADAISAFAENALPEKTRAIYMTHLADCDRCRKILSNLIMLDRDAEVSASASLAEGMVPAPVPWYRKLFLFPNLAYTMGALVLVFSGFLGFLVLQNSNRSASVEVSQGNTAAPARPQSAVMPSSETANTVTAANTNTSVAAGSPNFQGVTDATPGVLMPSDEAAKTGEDTAGFRESPKGPPTADVTTERDDGTVLRKEEDRLAAAENKPMNEARQQPVTGGMPAPAAAPPPPPPKKADRFGALTKDSDDEDKKNRAKSAMDTSTSGQKKLGTKTFNRSGGVWYDSTYQGQPTKDVRRGTSEYKNLDSGLRSIAESLSGTVVVVWKASAYRIQ